jgi:hypothetical protein
MPNDRATDFLTKAGRLCTEQADDVRSLMGRVHSALAPPRSPADLDHRSLLTAARSDDRQQLWSRVAVAHMHLAVHATDHLRALGLVLGDPQTGVPVYAHASLTRATVESAGLLLHLLAAGEPSHVRLARGVALLIVDASEAAKAADGVPGNTFMPAPGPKVTAQKDAMNDLIDRARIVRVPNRNGTATKGVRITPDGPEALVAVKASELVKAHFGDLPAIYNLLSGVVHGLPWGLADNASIQGREMRWQPDPVQIGGFVIVANTAASRVGAGFAAYRGFPDDPLVARLAARAAEADQLLRRPAASRETPPPPARYRARAHRDLYIEPRPASSWTRSAAGRRARSPLASKPRRRASFTHPWTVVTRTPLASASSFAGRGLTVVR